MSIEMQENRPPLVRFERRAKEDRAASLEKGHYATKDVDFALITPPYSKDCIEQEVDDWMRIMNEQVQQDRMPANWRDKYVEAYNAWKRGEEVPLDGTAIKSWPVISPAQRQNLIAMGVATVEDLAQINDEGMRRYGMGGLDLKQKAQAWLAASKDVGQVTQQIAALQADNETLRQALQEVMEANKQMLAELDGKRNKKAP